MPNGIAAAKTVGQSQLIRSAGDKPRQVWKISVRATSPAPFRAPQRFCEQIVRAHQTHHALGIDDLAFSKTIGHLPIAVARMLDQHFLDRGNEPRIAFARLGSKRAIERRSRELPRTRERGSGEAHHTIWRRNNSTVQFRRQREKRDSLFSRASSLMRRKAFLKIRFSAASWPSCLSNSLIFALL